MGPVLIPTRFVAHSSKSQHFPNRQLTGEKKISLAGAANMSIGFVSHLTVTSIGGAEKAATPVHGDDLERS